MSFNNKIIKGLIFSIIILSIILLINELFLKISIIESFIVSFISGSIVSLFVAYIQYDKERRDIIIYYNNEIISYYILLKHMLASLRKNNKTEVEKIGEAKKIFNNYYDNIRFRNNNLELNFILNSIDNKYRKKAYTILYEYTNGIELIKYFKKDKKNIKELEKICKKEQVNIIEGIGFLSSELGIEYDWDVIEKSINYRFYEKD